MTNHIGRIYAVAGAVLILFLGWAAISAHPWDAAPVDPRVAAIEAHRAQVRHDAAEAKRIVAVRWERYEARLAVRRREIRRVLRQRARARRIYDRRLAVARAHRPVIYRTVYASAGYGGGSSSSTGSSGGAGGYSAPSSAPTAGASAPAAAAPVVSVGASAPVTASGSS